jgi:peptide/nickel transport system substrate-binding protein
MNPSNDSASTSGYSSITKYKVVNSKKIIFYWHPAFADYKDLFGFILPKKAFSGISGGFNSAWTDCICGSDGNPVADGPYYLNSFSFGTGAQLKANPQWYGTAPSIGTVNWIVYADQNSEENAYNAHEVDAMYPGAATSLKQYIGQGGTTYSSIASYGQEHVDMNVGAKSLDNAYTPNPLMKNSWFRQAIMLGINRQAIINTVFNGIAKGITPLDNPVFFKVGAQTKWAVKQYAYMHQFNFDTKKAIKLLKAHCTGGPTVASPSNTKFWTCGGKSTDIGYFTTTRQARQTTGAIVQAELKSIGINVTTHFQGAGTFFGSTTVNQDYDLAEYAWSGGPDPSGFDAIYQCVNAKKNLGGQNWKGYCNPASDKAVTKGDSYLPAGSPTRFGFYETEAKLCGEAVCVIPYYGPPSILIYRSSFNLNNANNPTSTGPTWNIQNWK